MRRKTSTAWCSALAAAASLAAAALLAAGAAAGGVGGQGDWQLWLDADAIARLGPWKWRLQEATRIGNDARDIFYHHTELGVSRSPRYRSKLCVTAPWKLCGRLRPYVADEVFEMLDGGVRWTGNRAYAGVRGDLGRRVGIDVAYFLDSKEKSGDWSDLHAVQCAIQVRF